MEIQNYAILAEEPLDDVLGRMEVIQAAKTCCPTKEKVDQVIWRRASARSWGESCPAAARGVPCLASISLHGGQTLLQGLDAGEEVTINIVNLNLNKRLHLGCETRARPIVFA